MDDGRLITGAAAVMALSFANATGGQIAALLPELCLRYDATGSGSTPLPAGVPLPALLDPGTGVLELAVDPTHLVSSAMRYAQALAVIGIDPEAEALVDRIVNERIQGTSVKRTLPRKASG